MGSNLGAPEPFPNPTVDDINRCHRLVHALQKHERTDEATSLAIVLHALQRVIWATTPPDGRVKLRI